ncbi:MAG: hypothetical protein JWN76_1490 [Chitinophagaceae bacterium]|nr:hypothetical protein [Chitinophagaceae bacterium]
MKLIVTGATGTAGSEVIRQAIADDGVEKVTAIARRPLTIAHPKLDVILHHDFLDYSNLEEVFSSHDACAWCLGISQSQVSKQEYQAITHDYTIAAAHALLKSNPSIRFLFLSGQGADVSEKSRMIFSRIKGKTENALRKIGLKHLYIVRPGGIKPRHANNKMALVNKLMIPFFPILELLFPGMVISSAQLAKAIIKILLHQGTQVVYENNELKKLVQN